jgi:hypothetical protein
MIPIKGKVTAMRPLGAALLLALQGCGFISFAKPATDQEIRLRGELRGYYTEVQRAFAAGNSQALASLFDPSIVRPMNHAEIEAWGEKFFADHGPAKLKIVAVDIRDMGAEHAVVELQYAVEPVRNGGGFSAREMDTLVKRNGRWYVREWETLH